MNLKLFQTAKEFYEAAGEWLGQDEGANGVAIGVTKNLMSDKPLYDEAYFGTVIDGSEIVGTAVMTPPHPLNINGTTLDVIPHFIEMAKKIRKPQSVLGPGEFAKVFSKWWCQEIGCELGREEAQAIHRLERVNHPKQVGSVIVAGGSHQKLLEEWGIGFCRDCGMEEKRKGQALFVIFSIMAGEPYEHQSVVPFRTQTAVRLVCIFFPVPWRRWPIQAKARPSRPVSQHGWSPSHPAESCVPIPLFSFARVHCQLPTAQILRQTHWSREQQLVLDPEFL